MARVIRIRSGLRNKKKKKKKKQLHILQGLALANSKLWHNNHAAQALKASFSLKVRKDSVMLGYLLYICNLKLRLEAARRQYWRLMALKKQYLSLLESTNMKPKVVVKKAGGGYYEVKVTSERKEDMLVSTLEAFEIVGLDVLQARVSSGNFFSLDAFAVARDQRDMDAEVVALAILKALEKQD
ncbi:hypothetical protein MLD38_027581 [Melastoma candidum]|uniref:Uncharacterized protein n=1 Tax=Melastoma candidum TaxID=119954 RepID=A0ACB9P279_9MYRT|nr:hypothetical protein MLD38_027581 [Melastoma candidum]